MIIMTILKIIFVLLLCAIPGYFFILFLSRLMDEVMKQNKAQRRAAQQASTAPGDRSERWTAKTAESAATQAPGWPDTETQAPDWPDEEQKRYSAARRKSRRLEQSSRSGRKQYRDRSRSKRKR